MWRWLALELTLLLMSLRILTIAFDGVFKTCQSLQTLIVEYEGQHGMPIMSWWLWCCFSVFCRWVDVGRVWDYDQSELARGFSFYFLRREHYLCSDELRAMLTLCWLLWFAICCCCGGNQIALVNVAKLFRLTACMQQLILRCHYCSYLRFVERFYILGYKFPLSLLFAI